MKKILFSFVILLISIFVTTQFVHAEETNSVLNLLNDIHKINGKAFKFKQSFITDVENYYKDYEVSTADTNYTAEQIDEIIEIYKAASVDKWINLPEEERTKVKNHINEINENTSFNVSFSDEGVLTVYKRNGEELFKASNFLIELEKKEENKEKETVGNDSNLFIIIGGIAFAGLLIVTRNVVKER